MCYIENPPYQYGHLYRTFHLLQFLLLEVQFSILDDLQQTSVVDDRHVAPAPTLLRQQLLEDLGTDSIYNKPYTIRSLKASKPWGWGLAVSDSYEISQVSQQNCCRGARQISKRRVDLCYQSHGFETTYHIYDKTSCLVKKTYFMRPLT